MNRSWGHRGIGSAMTCLTAVYLCATPLRAGQLLRDTDLSEGLTHWRTSPSLAGWAPISAGVADLNPGDDYRGLLLWQALNVADPGGKEFDFQVELSRVAAEIGSAVSFAVEFIDTRDVRQRAWLLPVSNTMIPVGSWLELKRAWRCPADAKRLTRLLVLRDDLGHLRMRRPSLSHATLTNEPFPVIHAVNPVSGPYGWSNPVTITGANFGAAEGRVCFTKSGLDADSWSFLFQEEAYVTGWSDTSITFVPLEPNSGGSIAVHTAHGVETMQAVSFALTSPHFTVRNLSPRQSVLQGQSVTFNMEVRLSEGHPGFANGILLVMHDAPDGTYTITPETVYPTAATRTIPFTLTLQTGALAPGSYAGDNAWHVQTIEDRSYARFCPIEFDIVARGGGSRGSGIRPFDSGAAQNGAMGLPQPRVDLATLEVLLESVLFRMKTHGPPVSMGLLFSGRADRDLGMFGKGWRMSYESRVDIVDDGARLITSKGETLFFSGSGLREATESTPSVLVAPKGNYDSLTCYGRRFEYLEKESKLRYRYMRTDEDATVAWLVSVTDRNGQQLTLQTDTATGKISTLKDEANRSFTFLYNGEGLCTYVLAPDARSYAFSYQQGRISVITDPQGIQAVYAYDAAGYLNSATMAGKQLRFTYGNRPGGDGDKYVRTMEGPDGRQTGYAFKEGRTDVVRVTDSRGHVRELATQAGRPTTHIEPTGELSLIGYHDQLPVFLMDKDGGTTRISYDARGNVTQITEGLGGTSEMSYDSHDNLVSHKNVLGHIWTYAYDAQGNLIEVTNPLNRRTLLSRDSRGRIETVSDALGNTLRYAFDAWGNLSSVTDALGHQTRFEYASPGMRLIKVSDAAGDYKTFTYDGLDRVTGVAYHEASGALLASLSQTWSAYGAVSYTDELGQTNRVERNVFGQIVKRVDPLGAEITYGYDTSGNRISITDPLNRTAREEYDESNRLRTSINPMEQTVRRTYDPTGRLIELRDAMNYPTRWEYDQQGNVTREQDAAGKSVLTEYDALKQPRRRTNARGQEVLFTYDAAGNRVGKAFHGTASQYEYVYDSINRLVSMTGPDGTTTYTYTPRGALASVTYPNSAQMSFEYDAVGNMRRMIYPDGLTVDYEYDSFNRIAPPRYLRNTARELLSLSEPAKKPTRIDWVNNGIHIAYNPASQPTRISRANGVNSALSYDKSNRVTGIAHTRADVPLEGLTVSYNLAGEVIAQSFSDTLPLPTPEQTAGTFNTLNQISAWNGSAYVYDDDGNLTSAGGRYNAEYDPENRLTALAFEGGHRIEYAYNGLGQRVKRTENGVERHFLYDKTGRLLCVTDKHGNVSQNILYSGTALVAFGTEASGFTYPLFDVTGNVTALSDEAGDAFATYRYLPFGRKTVAGDPRGNLFTYSGIFGVQDQGGDLYAMSKRFYDASAAKFLHRDPLGITGGINLYTYGDNSPILKSDPGGDMPWAPILAAIWLGSRIYNAYGTANHGANAVHQAQETAQNAQRTANSFGNLNRSARHLMNNNQPPPENLDALIENVRADRETLRDAYNSGVETKDNALNTAGSAAKTAYHGARFVQGLVGATAPVPTDAAAKISEMAADAAFNELDRQTIDWETVNIGE